MPKHTKNETALLAEDNLLFAERIVALLDMEQPLYTADELRRFSYENQISLHEAYLLLLQASLRLEGRSWLERYLRPAIRQADAEDFRRDPYLKNIRCPLDSESGWRFTKLRYAPFQPFPCGHTMLTEDGRELPRIGYFTEAFGFPALLEGGHEWMAIKPNEIMTMREDIAAAHGNVLVLGLGLGYYPYMISLSAGVRAVTIVEKSGELIRLFKKHLLPQFPRPELIRIVQADAFGYLSEKAPLAGVDCVFADLWHDVGDGLPMYLRLWRLALLSPAVSFRYWIEEDMLVFLRALAIDDWLNQAGRLETVLPDPPELSLEDIRRLLPGIDPAWLIPAPV